MANLNLLKNIINLINIANTSYKYLYNDYNNKIKLLLKAEYELSLWKEAIIDINTLIDKGFDINILFDCQLEIDNINTDLQNPIFSLSIYPHDKDYKCYLFHYYSFFDEFKCKQKLRCKVYTVNEFKDMHDKNIYNNLKIVNNCILNLHKMVKKNIYSNVYNTFKYILFQFTTIQPKIKQLEYKLIALNNNIYYLKQNYTSLKNIWIDKLIKILSKQKSNSCNIVNSIVQLFDNYYNIKYIQSNINIKIELDNGYISGIYNACHGYIYISINGHNIITSSIELIDDNNIFYKTINTLKYKFINTIINCNNISINSNIEFITKPYIHFWNIVLPKKKKKQIKRNILQTNL